MPFYLEMSKNITKQRDIYDRVIGSNPDNGSWCVKVSVVDIFGQCKRNLQVSCGLVWIFLGCLVWRLIFYALPVCKQFACNIVFLNGYYHYYSAKIVVDSILIITNIQNALFVNLLITENNVLYTYPIPTHGCFRLASIQMFCFVWYPTQLSCV